MTLRSLVRDELVSRGMYPKVPPRVQYAHSGEGGAIRPFSHIAAGFIRRG